MDHIPPVGSVMTPFPYVVQVDDSVMTAKALMVEHEVRHLPVKDRNTLLGVLTDRDLKRALDPSLGLPPKEELFVRDVFVPDAYVVDVAEPLDGVLEQLSTQHIGSALVTKHGRLVGIFTLTDAARIFASTCARAFRATRGRRVPNWSTPDHFTPNSACIRAQAFTASTTDSGPLVPIWRALCVDPITLVRST